MTDTTKEQLTGSDAVVTVTVEDSKQNWQKSLDDSEEVIPNHRNS